MPEVVSLDEAIASCKQVANWLMSLPEDAKILSPDQTRIVIPDAKRAGKILQVTLFTMGTG